jgi:hypothetical protein
MDFPISETNKNNGVLRKKYGNDLAQSLIDYFVIAGSTG